MSPTEAITDALDRTRNTWSIRKHKHGHCCQMAIVGCIAAIDRIIEEYKPKQKENHGPAKHR